MKKLTTLAAVLFFSLFCKTNVSFSQNVKTIKSEWPSCINEKTDEPMDVVWVVPEILYGYNPTINNILAATGTLDELAISYEEMQVSINDWAAKYVVIGKGTFFVTNNDSLPGSKLIYSVERTEGDKLIPKLEQEILFLKDLKAVFYVVFRPRKNGT